MKKKEYMQMHCNALNRMPVLALGQTNYETDLSITSTGIFFVAANGEVTAFSQTGNVQSEAEIRIFGEVQKIVLNGTGTFEIDTTNMASTYPYLTELDSSENYSGFNAQTPLGVFINLRTLNLSRDMSLTGSIDLSGNQNITYVNIAETPAASILSAVQSIIASLPQAAEGEIRQFVMSKSNDSQYSAAEPLLTEKGWTLVNADQ